MGVMGRGARCDSEYEGGRRCSRSEHSVDWGVDLVGRSLVVKLCLALEWYKDDMSGLQLRVSTSKSNSNINFIHYLNMISNALLVAGLAGFAAAATTNTNLQTVFPTATSTTNLAAVKTIAAGASFDGGMKQWDRSRECSLQICNQGPFPHSFT
jgi:hypothetical protein